MSPTLSQAEVHRYSRHLLLPEIGIEGQEKLKSSRVLLIGAGGLGSPLALYLAGAGVGTIGLVDYDTVDVSNLHRQVLYGENSVGKSKLNEAAERLRDLNSHVNIELHEVQLTSSNALEIFQHYDIVADGTDNFPTRYLTNDACVLLGIPNVHGSIFKFDGQVSVFGAKDGPCYRCLYAEPPPPGLVPSCAEGGVLGVLPGVIGTLQATEVLKVLLGIGQPLIGRLLTYDALSMRFRELRLQKNPDCPICGDHPTIHALIDYEQFCGIRAKDNVVQSLASDDISVEDYAAWKTNHDHFLLDVREPHEFQIAQIGGQLIPLGELPNRLGQLPRDREIIVHCKMGGRSRQAVDLLHQAGFTQVKNLAGGIIAWSERIDSSIPKY